MGRKAIFKGGGGNFDRMEEPGWFLWNIAEMQTENRDGTALVNKNNKSYWRCIFAVVGGEHDGKQHAQQYYTNAGFKLQELAEAIGYDLDFDQSEGTEVDADVFADHEVVACLSFQSNSKYMEFASDNEAVPAIISVEDAKRLHEDGTIYVLNFDDPDDDVTEDEAL